MSTKIDRKIASSDTINVSRPKGNGSHGRMPNAPAPVFTSIHAANHATWNTRNGVDAAARVSASAMRSIRERCDACCAARD